MTSLADRYMSMREVLTFLGISQSTLTKYVREGLLSPVELPGGERRYSAVAVAALIGLSPAVLGVSGLDPIEEEATA